MPSVFCAFYARFSVSFLCQSARDHNGGRDTLCNSENECEAFRIIITRPRPVLAVCFIHTYIRVTYVHLIHAHARSMGRRAVLDNRGGSTSSCVPPHSETARDISLHRNRGIIDRQVCSARQIDGRGENDDRRPSTGWKPESLKDNGSRSRGTTTASRKSEIFLPFSPSPLYFSLSLAPSRDAPRTLSFGIETTFVFDCCVMFAGQTERY